MIKHLSSKFCFEKTPNLYIFKKHMFRVLCSKYKNNIHRKVIVHFILTNTIYNRTFLRCVPYTSQVPDLKYCSLFNWNFRTVDSHAHTDLVHPTTIQHLLQICECAVLTNEVSFHHTYYSSTVLQLSKKNGQY